MISARNREVSYRKALRKRRIAREVYSYGNYICEYYDNLHQYSKNKIHCSCPDCSAKTRNKGNRRKKSGNYSDSIHYKFSDLKKVYAMENDLIEEGYSAQKHRKRDRFT